MKKIMIDVMGASEDVNAKVMLAMQEAFQKKTANIWKRNFRVTFINLTQMLKFSEKFSHAGVQKEAIKYQSVLAGVPGESWATVLTPKKMDLLVDFINRDFMVNETAAIESIKELCERFNKMR